MSPAVLLLLCWGGGWELQKAPPKMSPKRGSVISVETYLCGDRLHGLNQTDGQLDGTGGVQSHLTIIIEILQQVR